MKWFHEGLVTEVLKAIEDIDPSRLQGIQVDGKAAAHTPYELPPKQLNKLNQALSGKAEKKIEVDQVPDKDVIAGITVRMGSLVIDGSLAGKLREEAREMRTT